VIDATASPMKKPPSGGFFMGDGRLISRWPNTWTKGSLRAAMMVKVRHILANHKYPPDKAPAAVDLVMKQAEVLSDDWTAP